jgi:hypothetical protein
MTRDQFDLFGADQPDLFPADATPVVYRADPDRIRKRLSGMILEMRQANSLPWTTDQLKNREYLVRQMGRFLPEDEAAQFCFEFEQEVERLKAA